MGGVAAQSLVWWHAHGDNNVARMLTHARMPPPTHTPQVPVLEAYAMTEASHQMCSNPLPKRGPHKAGTVGTAQGGVTVAILDPSNK